MDPISRINKKKRSLYNDDIPPEVVENISSYIPPIEHIKYKSFFFRSDIISNFSKDVKHTHKINGKQCILDANYKLYNIDDIAIFLLNEPTTKTRNYNPSKWLKQKQKLVQIIPKMLGKMCGKTINEKYVHDSFNANIKNSIENKQSDLYKDDIVLLANVEIENYIYNKRLNFSAPKRQRSNSLDLDEDIEVPLNSNDDSDLEPELESALGPIRNFNDGRTILEETFLSDESESEYEYEGEDDLDVKYSKQFKEKLKFIVGFMMVSRGKCKMFPNDYILNIICTNMSGVGTLLLGLYLYTILKHPIVFFAIGDLLDEGTYNLSGNAIIKYSKKHRGRSECETEFGVSICKPHFLTNDDLIPTCGLGLLELAHGYFNYAGLCSYQKFGFKYDKSLYSKDYDTYCISNYDPIPMSVYLGDDENDTGCYRGLTVQQKINKILNTIVGVDRCSQNKICAIENDRHKTLLSCLNTLITYQDFYMRIKHINNYNIVNDEYMKKADLSKKCINILKKINLIKLPTETNYDFIKKIMNDIESDNITDEVTILLENVYGGKKSRKKRKYKKNTFKKKRKCNKCTSKKIIR